MGMMKALRILLRIVAACAAAVGAYGIYIVWSFYFGVEAERSAFSAATWKERANVYAHNSDPGCVRGGMALDIVATDLLKGKSISAVKALLGNPDGTKGKEIYYELGQCSGLGWHDSVLQVALSNDELVTNVSISRR